MEKPTSELVEEAVQAVKLGEINLDNGETRFGSAWPEIKGEVALILDLEKAGQSFKTALRAPDLNKMWAKILPDLTLVEILPVSGTEANPDRPLQPNIIKVSRPETTPPAPEPDETPVEPISLSDSREARRNAPGRGWDKWRKPLVWAASIAIIGLLSLGSLVGVANAAEPGDFFYGTKIWFDNARQVVAFSPQDKKNFALSYCANRQQELEYLVKNNKLQYFADVATDYEQTIQKAFTGSDTSVSSDQASQIKAQQTRLNELASKLAATTSTGASQASADVTKLVNQLNAFPLPAQTNPVPTTTPGTMTPKASPSPSPGLSVTPALTATVTVSATTTSGIISGTVGITGTITAVTPTISATAEVSGTVGISETVGGVVSTPQMSVVAPPVPTSTPTPTSAPGNGGSNLTLSYNPTAIPTQIVAENGNSQGNDNANDLNNGAGNSNGNDTGNGNNEGNDNQQGNSNQSKPTANPTPIPPTATAKPPTATAAPIATPTRAATATPVPTTRPSSGDDAGKKGNNGNNGKPTKTEKPTNTPKPPKPPKPTKSK